MFVNTFNVYVQLVISEKKVHFKLFNFSEVFILSQDEKLQAEPHQQNHVQSYPTRFHISFIILSFQSYFLYIVSPYIMV